MFKTVKKRHVKHQMIDSIIDVQRCAEWLGLQTEAAQTSLKEQLSSWTSQPSVLMQRSEKFKQWKTAMDKDVTLYPRAHALFQESAEIEKLMLPLIRNESKLEEESYNEILFFKSYLKPLNFVPFLLTAWSVFRVYILPGLSLLVPFLTLLAPYFIIRFIFQLPMNITNYMNILQAMMSGNLQAMMNPDVATGAAEPSASSGAMLKQIGMVSVTFLQGILQPYWTHQHLHSVDSIIQENGRTALRFQKVYQSLNDLFSSHGFTLFRSPLPALPNEREATARLLLQPAYFKMALKYIGSLEVMCALAYQNEVHPVRWVGSSHPVFRIRDSFDFQVPKEVRKTVSVTFDTNRHALLTGPNKGGKSTVLRALSISSLFAHTYGAAMGHLTSTPFDEMFVCLKPDDLPGSKSRFEREIEFTANTLQNQKPVLVFIDELYHSTNPPDALRSCQIYCEKLWKQSQAITVISTHLFEFVENAPSKIQRMCCPATILEDNTIEFLYSLKEGICKVSSVDSLLQKNGLMAHPVRPESN